MSRLKELNLKRIAFYALGILLCYAGITYMDTWLTKGNQELNDSFNTIDWFCETSNSCFKRELFISGYEKGENYYQANRCGMSN